MSERPGNIKIVLEMAEHIQHLEWIIKGLRINNRELKEQLEKLEPEKKDESE